MKATKACRAQYTEYNKLCIITAVPSERGLCCLMMRFSQFIIGNNHQTDLSINFQLLTIKMVGKKNKDPSHLKR